MRALFSGTEGVRGVCTEHFTWPKPVANPRTGSFHPPGPTTRRGSPPSHWQARSRNPRHARRGRVFVSVELESCQRRRVGPPPPPPVARTAPWRPPPLLVRPGPSTPHAAATKQPSSLLAADPVHGYWPPQPPTRFSPGQRRTRPNPRSRRPRPRPVPRRADCELSQLSYIQCVRFSALLLLVPLLVVLVCYTALLVAWYPAPTFAERSTPSEYWVRPARRRPSSSPRKAPARGAAIAHHKNTVWLSPARAGTQLGALSFFFPASWENTTLQICSTSNQLMVAA